ncbi:MAG: hypothetical protein L3K19_03755 [Thermoplasmata archaeon]|nr:hypothetical protein [Thermoplasmata archaeon]
MTDLPRRHLGRARRASVPMVLLWLGTAVVVAWSLASAAPNSTPALTHSIPHPEASPGFAVPLPAYSVTPQSTGLSLAIRSSPSAICSEADPGCPAGTGTARVTLSADAIGGGDLTWPAVQIAFVLETTPYDGVYDSSPNGGEAGSDRCASPSYSGKILCEESNGVPYFASHAQAIADAIQQTNPHSQVSFALVDFFSTAGYPWDDGDGLPYHVDVRQFVPASEFGGAVTDSFQRQVLDGAGAYPDSDLSDNFLHSSSITALYGTITGSGLAWANDTHHVIVWIGSTAPRDTSYPENYCVSPHELATKFAGTACYGEMCEPAYGFPTGLSPRCEGWVHSSDGNSADSIAALAHHAPACIDSIGHVCTVDTIDLWNTPTDPGSVGWPVNRTDGGPNGPIVYENAVNILKAGCDLASATGGTWDGPTWYTCPDGTPGSLGPVFHGSSTNPTLSNPTLFSALSHVGFGPVVDQEAAGPTARPMFLFVPFGNIRVAANPQATAACTRGGAPLPSCQQNASILHLGDLVTLGWNFSTNATLDRMYVGDLWTASFNVVAAGPPYATVPIDACITSTCAVAGSGSAFGTYTSASFVPDVNDSATTISFPVATVLVELAVSPTGTTTLPPPPPPFPTSTLAAPPAIPVLQSVASAAANTIGVANISLQAAAGGFLSAGFTRVVVRNREVAMRIAARVGPMSRYDRPTSEQTTGVGRFE